jgi:imidazoleglycerol-phosphate dehydratase
MRSSEVIRKTSETDISLRLELDGECEYSISTGIGFLDHMLEIFARHGSFGLRLKCVGDTHIDAHHSVEDTAICLGRAFAEALGDMRGITRYGSALIPMDEALVLSAADISGRACLCFDLDIKAERVGEFDTELAEEFFAAFSRAAGITLHIRQMSGSNAHHIIEAAFKSVARSLKQAVSLDEKNPNQIPSTKGTLL